MKSRLSSERGQLLPISAMVMFTAVVFSTAAFYIYSVERAKLKAQNVADAVALNLASQQAALYNIVADRNEWLNHMYKDDISPSEKVLAQNPPDPNPCAAYPINYKDGNDRYPPISCAEGYIFKTDTEMDKYAQIVQAVNDAQRKFEDIYNSFLGVPGNARTEAKSIQDNLEKDIADLRQGHNLSVMVWSNYTHPANPSTIGAKNIDASGMERVEFEVKEDIHVFYYHDWDEPQPNNQPPKHHHDLMGPYTLTSRAHSSETVGIMQAKDYNGIDTGYGDRLENGAPANPATPHRGVAAMVTQHISILGGLDITARSVAVVVNRSGWVAKKAPGIAHGHDSYVFSPTAWVKLSNLNAKAQ